MSIRVRGRIREFYTFRVALLPEHVSPTDWDSVVLYGPTQNPWKKESYNISQIIRVRKKLSELQQMERAAA